MYICLLLYIHPTNINKTTHSHTHTHTQTHAHTIASTRVQIYIVELKLLPSLDVSVQV